MINASIVLYHSNTDEVLNAVKTLQRSDLVNAVYLIDNSSSPSSFYAELDKVNYVYIGKNLGYGKAHNIALKESISNEIPYHLVLNSDMVMDGDVISRLYTYLEEHTDVAQLMPKVEYPDGSLQYLCKLLPTPNDLIIRRFIPSSWNKGSRDRFELKHFGYNKPLNVPYLSGCFMFLRTSALKQVGLFDERYFMYPEDIALPRRLHAHYNTLYFSHVNVIHNHGRGSHNSF